MHNVYLCVQQCVHAYIHKQKIYLRIYIYIYWELCVYLFVCVGFLKRYLGLFICVLYV